MPVLSGRAAAEDQEDLQPFAAKGGRAGTHKSWRPSLCAWQAWRHFPQDMVPHPQEAWKGSRWPMADRYASRVTGFGGGTSVVYPSYLGPPSPTIPNCSTHPQRHLSTLA